MNWIGIRWLALMLAAGMGIASARAEGKKLTVLTSFLPLYCFTANVAGDAAKVEILLSAATGPHEYQFARKDAQKIETADLVIINGLQLESWLGKVLKNVKGNKKLVEASAGLEKEFICFAGTGTARPRLLGADAGVGNLHSKSPPNPHLWLDAHLACGMVSNILVALQQADPAHAAVFQANASAYIQKLESLDAELQAGLKPYAGSSIITFHDAFPYFARRYGLNIAGVIELVPDVNPPPRHLVKLHQAARTQKVKVIMIEPGTEARQARQLAADWGLLLGRLDTFEAGSLEPNSYEEGMKANLKALRLMLEPTAPK